MRRIINQDTKVIVHGITGKEGGFHTSSMLSYGTKVVAGVTPGKGGREVEGVPVYDTASEVMRYHEANTSIVFVPAATARDAVIEAIDAGIKTVVVITDGIPQQDTIQFIAHARLNNDVIIVGPNCPGIIDPRIRVKVGIMSNNIFAPGSIGIVAKSGTLTYEIASHITQVGMGQTTCIGIGGDPVIGLDFTAALEMFRDDETKAVVLIGEIGGNAEELAAQYIRETNYPKPVAAYVAGRLAPPGKRMGHAGAIVTGTTGTVQSKVEAFARAGIPVAEKPNDIVKLLGGLI